MSSSLSAAGRVLFDRSRERKTTANDADRLWKYLARFNLEWADLKQSAVTPRIFHRSAITKF